MKNLIIYSFFLVFSYGCQLQKTRLYEEEQEKRIATIQKIDFEAYYGKPIDSLIKRNIILQNYTFQRIVCMHSGCLSYWTLIYKAKKKTLEVNIYPNSELKFVPKRCINYPHEHWDMDLFKKETIKKVQVILFK